MTEDRVDLKMKQVVELRPLPPFAFDATMHKPDHFPSRDNAWMPGVLRQTMLWQGERLGLKFEDQGTLWQPQVLLSIWADKDLEPGFLDDLLAELEYRYRFQYDLTGFNQRFRADPHLMPILTRWLGMRPLNFSSLYEYLVIATVLQNCTVRRSVQMLQALFEAFGSLLAFDGQELYCFWAPAAIAQTAEEALRVLKLGYRAKTIKRVSTAFADRMVDEHEMRGQPKAEQRKALLGLYGIGPASVGYILFDVFHHWDELEHISPWEQRIYSRLFFGTEPDHPVGTDQLLEFLDAHFGEYKMLAVHYVWEDLFWRRQQDGTDWLEKLIRL